jgi:hypothetical protein
MSDPILSIFLFGEADDSFGLILKPQDLKLGVYGAKQ